MLLSDHDGETVGLWCEARVVRLIRQQLVQFVAIRSRVSKPTRVFSFGTIKPQLWKFEAVLFYSFSITSSFSRRLRDGLT